MKQDKRLQKTIQQEFETPKIPFETWCERTGIFSDDAQPAPYAVYEFADNVRGKSMGNGRRKLLSIWSPLLALLVVLLLVITCLSPRSSVLPTYGANDTEKQTISLQEITAQSDIYLFDFSKATIEGSASKEILITDPSRVMLYTVSNYLFSINDNNFTLTYNIRVYPNYELPHYDTFISLENEAFVHGKQIKYEITGLSKPVGYAMFSDGKYDYFIEVASYKEVTTVTEDNFLNLLNNILI